MRARVLIVVTHLLGAGHLTRAAAIARSFAAAGHDATLISGGMPTPLLRPGGATLVQLPPVRARIGDFRTLLDGSGREAEAGYLAARRARLLAALRDARPDILVTELYPFGRRSLAAELDALLEAAAALEPRPLVVSSIRDVLARPGTDAKARSAHDRIARRYDAVLVHGDEAVVPLDASWPVDPGLRPRLAYTGYVDDGDDAPTAEAARDGSIVVSGGSSAAALPLYRAALESARSLPERRWRLLVGHGIGEADHGRLLAEAPANVAVERARPDFRRLLARADLFVGQAGYNTVTDLFATGVRALLVPFEAGGETEQRLRAEVLAARDLATVLRESDLTPRTLTDHVTAALARPAPAATGIRRDGAHETVRILVGLLRDRRPPRKGGPPPALAPFREMLDRIGESGRRIDLWWRDDDAVAATPALDRLLALANEAGAPLAIAAIPAALEASLPERLAGESGVRVLPHGFAHRDHAPAGAKSAEFGGHRPGALMVEEVRRGLAIVARAFGPQTLPVFVPPWNRIDPALPPRLAEAGFAGLSCFGRAHPGASPALRTVNTHLDPVDWRGTRSLADPAALAAAFTAAAEGGGPVGLLSHHLAFDEATWRFWSELVGLLAGHPAIRFPALGEIWPDAASLNCPRIGDLTYAAACP